MPVAFDPLEKYLAEIPMTLQEIGEQYGIARETVRQTEKKLLKKLRTHLGWGHLIARRWALRRRIRLKWGKPRRMHRCSENPKSIGGTV